MRDAANLGGDCFILFVLSHGGIHTVGRRKEEVMYGTDGKPVTKKSVLENLSDMKCSNLKGKPRIVFFNSCRGGK